MADPATAGGDPRDAQYWANLAKIKAAGDFEKTEGVDARKRLAENAAYQVGAKNQVGEGQIGKQEWPGYRNLRNQSSRQGLLRSGVQAERHGTLQSQYAARRYAVTHGQTESEGALTRSEAAKQRGREGQEVGELTNAQERARQYALEHPATPPAAPAPNQLPPGRDAPPPGYMWTNSGGGGYVPIGTKVYKAYAAKRRAA